MADTPQNASTSFSESELKLLARLNAMSGREFVDWFRASFEPSIHSVRAVTSCNHILGGRLDPSVADHAPPLLGLSARWS
jgi:hypothetical protein